VRRGEVRWYQCPQPNQRRPVGMLPRDSAREFLGEVTLAPITTTIRKIPPEVPLTAADGLPRACAIQLDHGQAGSRARVGPLIPRRGAEKLRRLRGALLFALAFREDCGAPRSP
jgi:mRNA interferase MazF